MRVCMTISAYNQHTIITHKQFRKSSYKAQLSRLSLQPAHNTQQFSSRWKYSHAYVKAVNISSIRPYVDLGTIPQHSLRLTTEHTPSSAQVSANSSRPASNRKKPQERL
ncbi:hypothetical protein F511_24343 [Dorcoceras hygrometricum]|uniref:Uncharacterized protein n=1 Tax=Dorcoceras hygrometricum TaxID=472368 RepID=A0A2Z7D7D2_9LAMI|nr:hypothetical protein F511_24343 [Dorcoceras hygrometricum]